MARLFSILSSILLVVSLYVSPARAQGTTSGTVLGTVSDSTGAVLPGAEVTATNLGTSRSRTVISDDEGRYLISTLSLGTYEVAAVLPGFQTAVQTGIEMTIGRRAVVNFTLSVGEITERVTVTGEAPLIETTSCAANAGRTRSPRGCAISRTGSPTTCATSRSSWPYSCATDRL